HRLKHHPQQPLFFLVGGGRRLPGGAVDDQAVVAHVGDEIVGEAGGPVVVDGPVGVHGGDHRRHHLPERGGLGGSSPLGGGERRRVRRHTRTLPAAGCAE